MAAWLALAKNNVLVSGATESGRSMKAINARAASGCGASLGMTRLSCQISVPSRGIRYTTWYGLPAWRACSAAIAASPL
ncbi:hypothetical protein D3C75_1258220 [compost metagenome]